LWLVDRDIVEWSNLQRQVLYTEADAAAGAPKAVAAAARLSEVNRECKVTAHVADCSASFLRGLGRVPDLVLDGTDNFPTRYLLNDWCAEQRIPWIYAGAVGTEGAAMVVSPGGPCLRCLWPAPPETADVANCETAGILAPTIAAVAAFQVAEALKLLVGGLPPTRASSRATSSAAATRCCRCAPSRQRTAPSASTAGSRRSRPHRRRPSRCAGVMRCRSTHRAP
jgi:adenylyltransferase/sulfurtransferase